MKVAVVGAGIYGSIVALEFLKNKKICLDLYDPKGFFNGASSINQFRIHKGYHYPRSQSTFDQIYESTQKFNSMFKESIVQPKKSYYAIGKQGSKTDVEGFESFCHKNKLSINLKRPSWIDYKYIDNVYEVEENLYNPNIIRTKLWDELNKNRFQFHKKKFMECDKKNYDLVIYCTYGVDLNGNAFSDQREIQLVEKIKIKLPHILRGKSLVIIDGDFTAFDPLPHDLSMSQFGSSKFTKHEVKDNIYEFGIDEKRLINKNRFYKSAQSNFNLMKLHASRFVPEVFHAEYIGSKFTYRIVEKNKKTDQRLVEITQIGDREVAVLSGKIVSASEVGEKVKQFCDKL